MSGEDTELDRTVIIIRIPNSFIQEMSDHGLETKRRKINSEIKGHVYLRAYQDGNNSNRSRR